MGVADGIIVSTDGGDTWTQLPGPVGADDPGVSALSCQLASSCVAFTGSSTAQPGASTSTDFGTTWTQSSVPDIGIRVITGVTCSTSSNCFAVGSQGFTGDAEILASSDGGATWSSQTVPTGTSDLSAVACASPTDCIAVGETATGNALIASSDGAIASGALTILNSSLPTGSVYAKTNKAKYTAQLAASGGNPPYRWTLAAGSGPLPPGLKLNANGAITGKATTPGTYPITVQVSDKKVKVAKAPPTQNTAAATLSINISPAP
jgi:hypothetical protein